MRMTAAKKVFATKQPNRNRIFRLIMNKGKISRQSIAGALRLSLPTVNQYLDHLFEAGLIQESGTVNSAAVGRKAKAISINPVSKIALGLDITQHHISLVAVDLCGHVLHSLNEQYVFTDLPEDYEHLGTRVNRFIKENRLNEAAILGLGITLPAIISGNGTIVETAKLLGGAVNFHTLIGRQIGLPYRLYNDANAGGFSELYARRGAKRLIYLSLSHSIGGALIENNQIGEGDNCRGGEFGHMILEPRGILCHCGQGGCANCYCSPDVLSANTGEDLQLFFQKLSEKDPVCEAAFDQFLWYLSAFVHNIRMCFDCDIVLGGGMGQYVNLYIDALRERVKAIDSFDNSSADYLKSCFYPLNASAVGGALFFIDEFIHSI